MPHPIILDFTIKAYYYLLKLYVAPIVFFGENVLPMDVHSTKHIQILPVDQRALNPLEASPRTHVQHRSRSAMSERSPESTGQPVRIAGRYDKGHLVDTYA